MKRKKRSADLCIRPRLGLEEDTRRIRSYVRSFFSSLLNP